MSSNSQIPDVLKVKNLPVVSNMDIFTERLEPITKTQERVNFVLQKKGILDAGSRIQFSVHNNDAGDDLGCFLPIGVGAMACIKNAYLRFGNRLVARSQSVNHYSNIRTQAHTSSQKKEIDMPLMGVMNSFFPSPLTEGRYSLADVEYSSTTNCAVWGRYGIVNSTSNCATWSVGIADLFPMMKGVQLPLFAINEPVSIEIEFTQQLHGEQGKTICFRNGKGGSNSGTNYGLDNVKMLVDYLQYDDNTMAEVKNQIFSDTGMNMVYSDLALTSTQIPAVSQPSSGDVVVSKTTREVASAGMKVKNVLVAERNANWFLGSKMVGDYRSDAMIHPVKFNWRCNERIVYPRQLENTSYQRQEVEQILDFPLSCPSVVYSFDCENDFYTSNDGLQNRLLDGTIEFEGHIVVDLAGTQYFTGLDLRKGRGGEGTQVQQKNILYERTTTHSRDDYQARNVDFWTEHERVLNIRNGVVSVSA
jgi:hypothetical protein